VACKKALDVLEQAAVFNSSTLRWRWAQVNQAFRSGETAKVLDQDH